MMETIVSHFLFSSYFAHSTIPFIDWGLSSFCWLWVHLSHPSRSTCQLFYSLLKSLFPLCHQKLFVVLTSVSWKHCSCGYSVKCAICNGFKTQNHPSPSKNRSKVTKLTKQGKSFVWCCQNAPLNRSRLAKLSKRNSLLIAQFDLALCMCVCYR